MGRHPLDRSRWAVYLLKLGKLTGPYSTLTIGTCAMVMGDPGYYEYTSIDHEEMIAVAEYRNEWHRLE